jgi:pimeloyl-ACP methyl ester carboxylesterase
VVDAAGNAYVTGYTDSLDFPALNQTPGACVGTCGTGAVSSFVAKFNPTGSALVYSTYLGGSVGFNGESGTQGTGIAVDAAGNAYVTGETSSQDFPTANPIIADCGICYYQGDAFVTEINSTATALTYSTYLGGSQQGSWGSGIAVDSAGNAYVTGFTGSPDFPTANPLQAYCDNCLVSQTGDAFVAKISAGGGPFVTLSPTTLTFPNQTLNTTSAPQSVTVTNSGNANLTFGAGAVTLSGANAADFAISADACSGATLAPSATCSVSVTFTPSLASSETTTLTLTDNAANSPQTVSLTGNGIVPPPNTPVVSLSTFVLTFPDQTVSTISAGQTLTLTNTGTGSLTIGGITPNGDFAVAGSDTTCSSAVPVAANGGTCFISVAFSPTTTGPRTGSIDITDNAADSPQSILLSGMGTPMPVILIPGIMGSTLTDESSGEQLWLGDGADSTYSKLSLFPIDKPSPTISGTDVVAPDDQLLEGPTFTAYCATNPGGCWPYSELINYLASHGYPAYNLGGNPSRLTSTGCDVTQAAAQPKLFVFPYDWRLSNAANASKLADYIGCIQNFYKGTEVNIIAHSMGGLVARRFIITNAFKDVNSLITIATPWLGAPMAIQVLATGQYPPISPWIMSADTLKYVAGSMTGVHELLPSEAYFSVASLPPFTEEGWDWDNDGNAFEVYDYSQYLAAVSQFGVDKTGTHVFYPGTATQSFHNYSTPLGGEDDWSSDSSGIAYYQLYGIESVASTIGQVSASTLPVCVWDNPLNPTKCSPYTYNLFLPSLVNGDGTVPTWSATGVSINNDSGSSSTLGRVPFVSTSSADDGSVTHEGLLDNPDVQTTLVVLLSVPLGQSASASMLPALRKAETSTTTVQPAVYLTIVGANNVVVSDTLGNNTAQIVGDVYGTVPGVTTYSLATSASMIIMPSTGEYNVTFGTTTTPMAITITIGPPGSATQAIRYVDVNQPSGLAAKMHFLTGSIGPLLIDTNKDGTFATTVNPTASLTGSAVNDTTPPTVSFSASVAGAITTVAISASDSGSGVKDLFYSLDGTTFQAYAGALQLDASKNAVVYSFADDNAANRSSLIAFNLPRPAVTLQVPSLNFADIVIRATSAAQSVTLTNSSSTVLAISGITNSGDFAQTNNCGTTLAAAANCTINVSFTPTAAGARSGAVTITDNAPGSPHVIALSGTGTDFAVNPAAGSSTSTTVAAGQSATYNLSFSGSAGFNGTVALACTGAPSLSSCTVSPTSMALAGATPANATVTATTTGRSLVVPQTFIRRPTVKMPQPLLWSLALLMWGALIAWAAGLRRRVPLRLALGTALFLVVILGAFSMPSCGGGGSTNPPPGNPGTPAGTYTLDVTGTITSGTTTLTHDIKLTLTVQ